MISLDDIFPCIVPDNYLDEVGLDSSIQRKFTVGLNAVLIVDIGTSIRGLLPSEAIEHCCTIEDAWEVAIGNLDKALKDQLVNVTVLDYASGANALLLGPGYLGPALLIHPGVPNWLSNLLNAEDLLLVIPVRDAAFVYSTNAPADVLAGAKNFAAEARANSRKPYPNRLYLIGPNGIELVDPMDDY
jgi:hypothetical protein